MTVTIGTKGDHPPSPAIWSVTRFSLRKSRMWTSVSSVALWFREFMFITWEDHIGAIFSFEFPDVKLTDIL